MKRVIAKFPNESDVEIAGRVARLHNGGIGSNWDSKNFKTVTKIDAYNYVKRFIGTAGYQKEGDWNSLRCTERFTQGNSTNMNTQGSSIGGLEITPLILF